ncbi:hypothetical protein [Streptococcus marmotae]|nr:hypothetical protein [Streptococcus marmotae]
MIVGTALTLVNGIRKEYTMIKNVRLLACLFIVGDYSICYNNG